MRTRLFPDLMILLVACWGCKHDKATEPVSLTQLVGKWHLLDPSFSVKITLNLTLLPPLETAYTTASRFQGDGQAVINSYSTVVTIPALTTGQISVDPIERTKVGGSVEVVQFE